MPEQAPYQVTSEQDYQQTLSTLSQAKQPAAILKLMMRGFETYRAARKMGWSRPWNKYDLVNFQSLRIKPEQDRELIALGQQLILAEFPELPTQASEFITELLQDTNLMGFIFAHEYHAEQRRWEGATLSLGRKNAKRYRDRLDIILESEIIDGRSSGLSRIRVYIDPYGGQPAPPLWQAETAPHSDTAQTLFGQLCEASWSWPLQEERLWDHWTSRYIDYFGPRQFELSHSYFALPAHPEGRLDPKSTRQSELA